MNDYFDPPPGFRKTTWLVPISTQRGNDMSEEALAPYRDWRERTGGPPGGPWSPTYDAFTAFEAGYDAAEARALKAEAATTEQRHRAQEEEAARLKAEADLASAQTNSDELLADLRRTEAECAKLGDAVYRAEQEHSIVLKHLENELAARTELGEAMRLVGIAQFEANAARLKAEAALQEIVERFENDSNVIAFDLYDIAQAALSEKGDGDA